MLVYSACISLRSKATIDHLNSRSSSLTPYRNGNHESKYEQLRMLQLRTLQRRYDAAHLRCGVRVGSGPHNIEAETSSRSASPS